MTHTSTEQERAEFEALGISKGWNMTAIMLASMPPKFSDYLDPSTQRAYEAWQAARRAQVVPQLEPVEGDQLPQVGSRIFIRHGRDDDAHACIVTGYYVWGDLKGDKRLHRVFVRMVYEGTQTQNTRMLCDCYKTEAEALAAGPQPPEAASTPSAYRADVHKGECIDEHCPGCCEPAAAPDLDKLTTDVLTKLAEAAPVQLPEPVAVAFRFETEEYGSTATSFYPSDRIGMGWTALYTEHQVRQLLATQEPST